MSDLLSHLVDAPFANILILAGLGFLAIAVIGKISGKIDPSATGRAMAGVVGIALLVYGIYSHSAADKLRPQGKQPPEKQSAQGQGQSNHKSEERPPKSPLAGNWKNNNPTTRGITRLEVQQEGETVRVHAWGACSPQDCDWGTQPAAINGDSASIAWDQGFVLRKMTLTPDAARLRMTLDNVFRDSRAPQHRQEFFVRAD